MDENKYQVFLCTCPVSLPFSLATHPWFVINLRGETSRWEVLFSKRNSGLSFGYIHKDLFPLFRGIEIFPYNEKHLWKGRVLSFIEGGAESIAAKMALFIEESHKNYPYIQEYSLLGRNSNTYAQWILNHFPESNMQLPWNAFGKNRT